MTSSKKAAAPAPQAAPEQAAPKKSLRWEGDQLIVEGNVTADEINKAMADKKTSDDLAFKANSPSRAADKESPDAIAAREKATLANPKKQRLRGQRTLQADSPLGAGEGLG